LILLYYKWIAKLVSYGYVKKKLESPTFVALIPKAP
jgi:hypothetical protein